MEFDESRTRAPAFQFFRVVQLVNEPRVLGIDIPGLGVQLVPIEHESFRPGDLRRIQQATAATFILIGLRPTIRVAVGTGE
jgi:hypothetical protein